MEKIKKLIKYLPLAVLFSPLVASALGLTYPDRPTNLPGDQNTTISGTILRYLNVFLGIVGILAVAYLIYGGFRYITSAGNEETAEEAKKIIQNAIIGLIVIILSYIIITVIIKAVGYQTV
jgi:amino acid transporter